VVREIPERPFPLEWLVDTLDRCAGRLQFCQERGVGGLEQPAGDLQLGLRQLCSERRMRRPGITIVG